MADEDWNDSDEEIDEDTTTNVATNLLIAIDTDEAMFAEDLHGASTFKNVLVSSYEILDGILLKVGRGRKNIVAVVAVSDDKEKVSISDFDDQLPMTLNKIRKLCDKPDKELKDMYMREDALDMSHFLIHCKNMFAQCNPDNLKYLVYITKTDNPIKQDENKKFHAINQAKTLSDFKISIELLTFNPNFDYSLFFHELLLAAQSKFTYEYFINFVCLKEKLLSMIIYKGRKVKFYPFRDSADEGTSPKSFEVIEKSYLKESKILNNVKVTKAANQEVKKHKRGTVRTNRFKVKYSKHRSTLEFSAAEYDTMMYNGMPTGLQLLSVAPKVLQPGMHNTNPKFIQNSEKDNVFFDLLWQYCVDKDRVLLGAKKYSKTTRPRIVEMSPKVINGVRSFLVLGFPFQENIDIVENEDGEDEEFGKVEPCTEEELRSAERLVKTMKFKYNPSEFHNLMYCKKKDFVRSHLLEEKPLDVMTVLEKKPIVKQEDVSEVVDEFKQICFVETTGRVKKRKNASEGGRGRARKK